MFLGALLLLKAQQALLEQQWHPAMSYHDHLEAAVTTRWPPFAGSATAAAAAVAPRPLAESNSSSSSSSSSSLAGVSRSMHGGQHSAWQLPGTPQQQQLFRGLRVRMGIATGLVARGNSIKNSTVYKAAQGGSLLWHHTVAMPHTHLHVRVLLGWMCCTVG
jgi:hypothetical protein